MFRKKICRRCGRSSKEKYGFCPYCGNMLDKKKEDRGMLGKDDFFNDSLNEFKLPMGFNLIFNSLMKNMERQLKDLEKKSNQPEKKTRQTFIFNLSNGGNLPFELESPDIKKQIKKVSEKKMSNNFSGEKLKKFSVLPKEEPKTNIRRISNKVIYEVDLPGVKSSKDISILNLAKGIELKALSEKKAYLKSIPITLPIIAFKLRKGKLILEMDGTED